MEATPRIPPAAPKPWTPPAANAPVAAPRAPAWEKFLPFIGPIVLFILWDLAVRTGFIKALLLPPPLDAIGALVKGLFGGPLLKDFGDGVAHGAGLPDCRRGGHAAGRAAGQQRARPTAAWSS
jgi:hypothetical protein